MDPLPIYHFAAASSGDLKKIYVYSIMQIFQMLTHFITQYKKITVVNITTYLIKKPLRFRSRWRRRKILSSPPPTDTPNYN